MTEQQPISPLVAELITANLKASHATTNALIDGLERRSAELSAELKAVRVGIAKLIHGRYMPTTTEIERALYPSEHTITEMQTGVDL